MALKEMKAKSVRTATPVAGCQPALRLDGKIDPGPYVVPHAVRHFLLAADRLGVFNYEALIYLDIDEHVPDVTRQSGKVANLTLAAIKADFGVDPFSLSCHLCVAHQFLEEDLLAVLKLPYASLYEPIGKWICSLPASGRPLDSHPPNLYSLLYALTPRLQGQEGRPTKKRSAKSHRGSAKSQRADGLSTL